MDQSVGSMWTRPVVGVRRPGVSVCGLPYNYFGSETCQVHIKLFAMQQSENLSFFFKNFKYWKEKEKKECRGR